MGMTGNNQAYFGKGFGNLDLLFLSEVRYQNNKIRLFAHLRQRLFQRIDKLPDRNGFKILWMG